MNFVVSTGMATVVSVTLPRALVASYKTSYKLSSCSGHSQKVKLYYVLGGVRFKSTPATASLMKEDENVSTSDDKDSKKDSLDLSFYDHEAAFRSKTTREILRAMFVFQCCSIKPLVNNNQLVNIIF